MRHLTYLPVNYNRFCRVAAAADVTQPGPVSSYRHGISPAIEEMSMKSRLNPYVVAPELTKLLIDFSHRIAQAGLEPSLVELVKIRASQINGCAICLHMHALDARKNGESD